MQRLLPLLVLLAGCGNLPRDTDGTLDRVRGQQVLRVGVIADTHADRQAIAAFAARVGQAAGARPRFVEGAAEPLFAALDQDRLDLVVGVFGKDTPWATEVTLTPPIARYSIGNRPLFVRGAVRNGENRWGMLVEKTARAQAPQLADAS